MISVLIPIYHNHKFAIEAIKSALNHSKKIEKIYIFDDNPISPLKKFDLNNLLKHKKIIYKINNKNIGRIKNYNKLVMSCTSDFFIMLDGDDLLSKDIDFDLIQSELRKDKKIHLIVGLCKEFNLHIDLLYSTRGARKFGKLRGSELFYDWVGSKNLLPHSACIFNTKVVRNLGLYSDKVNNPEILLARKVLMRTNVLSLNSVFSYWRRHDKNTSSSFDINTIVEEFKSYIEAFDMLKNDSRVRRYFWLIRSILFYLTSNFHIIYCKTYKISDAWFFYKIFARKYLLRRFIFLISFLISTPKIISLFSLAFFLSRERFRALMISRKIWLYEDNLIL
jgi:glycosyltransferase involved in cell wall biosynthesis